MTIDAGVPVIASGALAWALHPAGRGLVSGGAR